MDLREQIRQEVISARILAKTVDEAADAILILADVVGRSEQCCEPLPKDSFYLGTTCPKCNKPFRNV